MSAAVFANFKKLSQFNLPAFSLVRIGQE